MTLPQNGAYRQAIRQGILERAPNVPLECASHGIVLTGSSRCPRLLSKRTGTAQAVGRCAIQQRLRYCD